MKNFIKKIIRDLYWRYGHDGDPWQTRLVIYHLGNIIAKAPYALPKKDCSSRVVLAQIEEHMNSSLIPNPTVKLNPIADIKIGGCIE